MIFRLAERSIWYSLSVSVWLGGDDNAVAGVDAEGVEVFHVADGDAVVGAVPDDLVFQLLPARRGNAR